VAVIVVDGLGLRVPVVKFTRGVGVQEKVVVDEGAHEEAISG
jgi:hypothetical protein